MIANEYVIMAPQGIHARPATTLIRLTKNFKSTVSLKRGDKTIRLNSMLNILSMTIKGGEIISVIVDGDDEAEAAKAIGLFFTEQLKDL
ncbi:HPr family phosphocarrier protein [Mucilaginibacter sp. McL0603]|uniref:HPr family phosphocarrier protein n=1 Tax=Mucilaginibacter sp. McL0603 TaxID=3415670 RepID=UPI003CFA0739